jgi:hypothetical protein
VLTKNTKFEQFVDDLFKLKVDKYNMKIQLVSYISELETFYNEMVEKYKTSWKNC